MRSRKTTDVGTSWRGDAAWIWVAVIEFAVLVIPSAILITLFAGAGFGPWLSMARASALGWLIAVVILIPRSAPRR
ncbi:MAG: hypothetical protein M3R49_11590 [Chloroflexota bacterium]|nr:hypothetical protein [Chloroflexota bacterium]MDQ2941656.1 hypothetical protein [Chloroflexota bacterium]